MSLKTPVSIGEALDKLSILDIKLDLIKDQRRQFVQVEYDLLYNQVQEFIQQQNQLYKMLKNINLVIWHEMDLLRDGVLMDETYCKLCRKTMMDNDIRFRIKNKINNACRSDLKEQKGYKKTSIFLDCSQNQDIKTVYFFIQYFSVRYDETIVLTSFLKLQEIFSYDYSILFTTNKDVQIKTVSIPDEPIHKILDELEIPHEELEIYKFS